MDSESVPVSCIPLPLSNDILNAVVPAAKDYALLNGAGMRYRGRYNAETLEMAPFFLLPSPFPKRDFENLANLQPHVNLLMHKVAHDYDFLHSCLKKTILVDDFTQRLWNIYETVRKEGISQEVSLGLLRSDLMLSTCDPINCKKCDTPPYVTEYQVEVNSIASGFGHMGPVSARIQKYILSYLGRTDLLPHLPENTALEDICQGMIYAWDYYGASKAAILFIVEDVTYNICDQRFHEYEIRRARPEIQVLRKTLTEVSQCGILTQDKELFVNDVEIAVVYFRCGYKPAQYPTEKEWEARLNIERSKAIKSPSIYYHLAGTKKVQQEVSKPGVLTRYLPEKVATEVSLLFTGLYSLDLGEEGDEAISMALKNPEKFVLKPQREGGGNNVYGSDIPQVLSKIKDSKEREAYILMDRIQPPITKNYIIRGHQPASLEDVVSEFGLFGVIIGTNDKILVNKFAGHMLRTKISTENEGGVAAGQGALDSVFLI